MIKKLNNISLKTKLVIVYLVLVVILIMTLGYYVSNRLNKASFYSSIELSNIASEQLKENFENKIAEYYKMTELIKNDSRFTDYLNTEYEEEYDSLKYYIDHIESIFSNLAYKDNTIKARVYSNNKSIGFSRITNNSIEDLERLALITKDDMWKLGINWTNPVAIDYSNGFMYIGCYKSFPVIGMNEIKAVLVLFFKEEQLYNLFNKERESGKKIFIYNGEGNIITSTERSMLGKNMKHLEFAKASDPAAIENDTMVKYGDNTFLYVRNEITKTEMNIHNWGIISLVPTDKLLSDTRRIWVSTFIICILCSIFSSIIILFISNNVTSRISNLLGKMESVKKGDFNISENVSGSDEIGVLERNFYSMVDEIDTLINEVYISSIELKNSRINSQKIEMEKKEAEIIALQGQINPHYLFNTLEAIRMNLLLKGDRKTADIILIFGESFRATFDTKSDFFSISQEMDFINNYIQIQKYRYKDKINCIINIPEQLYSCSIPKLILQPIVENAIYHGLEPKLGKGTIVIEAFESECDIFFKVTDDGVGMDIEEMDSLNAKILEEGLLPENRNGGRIALKNVNKRLRLMYGEKYGLKFSSEKGKGTVVVINIKKTGIQ